MTTDDDDLGDATAPSERTTAPTDQGSAADGPHRSPTVNQSPASDRHPAQAYEAIRFADGQDLFSDKDNPENWIQFEAALACEPPA